MKDIPAWALVLVVIAAIGLGLWAEKTITAMLKRKREGSNKPSPLPIERVSPLTVSSTPAHQHSSLKEIPIATVPLVSSYERIQQRKAVGASLESSINTISVEFGNRVSIRKIIDDAAQVGYPPSEIANSMKRREYEVREIATLLADKTDADLNQTADIVMSLTEGTVAERADKTFEVVNSAFNPDDDDQDLIGLPVRLGCSITEAATILHRNTNLGLGSVIRKLNLSTSPEAIAKIATELDVDLSKEDEYSSLCNTGTDNELGFAKAATILKACGKSAADIIGAENSINGFNDEYPGFSDNEMNNIFQTLSGIGFSKKTIMAGIKESKLAGDYPLAAIMKGALANETPMDDVISFLKEEEVDPETLDDEMRDAEDFGLRERTDVLYAYFHTSDPTEIDAAKSTQ